MWNRNTVGVINVYLRIGIRMPLASEHPPLEAEARERSEARAPIRTDSSILFSPSDANSLPFQPE